MEIDPSRPGKQPGSSAEAVRDWLGDASWRLLQAGRLRPRRHQRASIAVRDRVLIGAVVIADEVHQ